MYTVKEIAGLLGVSKPTVQKVINENFIEADKLEKNKFRYYSYEKTVFIIRVINPDFNFSIIPKNTENTPKNTAKSQIIPQELLETTEKPQSEETFNRMLSIIEQQLAEKNKLLAQKDKEIQELREQSERERSDLQNKLAAAYSQISDMAQKAQYITAADKTVLIMEKQRSGEKDAAESVGQGSSAAAATDRDKSSDISSSNSSKKGLFARIFGK